MAPRGSSFAEVFAGSGRFSAARWSPRQLRPAGKRTAGMPESSRTAAGGSSCDQKTSSGEEGEEEGNEDEDEEEEEQDTWSSRS